MRSVTLAVPLAGTAVPGTCGPQTALASGAGIGGVPLLKQIMLPIYRRLQPFHAHVFLLKFSIAPTVREYAAARLAQLSFATIVYVAQDPSLFGLGE